MKPKEPYFLLERWHKLAGIVLKEQDANISDEGDIAEIRKQLQDWMNQDQKLNNNPPARKSLQDTVWPYIVQHADAILQDVGPGGKGDCTDSDLIDGVCPAAFSAWLLVQHMDADPSRQTEFLGKLEQAIPNHVKIQFLRDRAAVNKWILKHKNDENSGCNDERYKGEPTIYSRDQTLFPDGDPTSREQALAAAQNNGNKCLVNAVNATGAQTQPSYQQKR